MAPTRPGEPVAEELADRTLMDVVRGRSGTVDPTEALRTLLARDPSRSKLLTDLVTDADRPVDVRAMCAVALGRQATASHERALRLAVEDRQPAVTRRAAESLGRIGSAASIEVLEGLSPKRGQTKRSVDLAKSLISYRLGLDTHRLRRPPASSHLRVAPRVSVAIEPSVPSRQSVRRMLEDTAAELPGIELSDEGAVQFSCDEDYAVVLTNQVRSEGSTDLLRRNAVAGAVLQRSPATGIWFLDEYLLADPGPRGTVRLFGVRSTGAVTHVGEFQPRGGTFTIHAVDTPGSVPIAVSGTYDLARGRLEFDRFRVQTQRARSQKPPRQPRLLDED